ncbi:hypothetical protein PV326_008278, partial [Microctonus aethiopoides]
VLQTRYQCQQCGRDYSMRCNLRRHMKYECGGKRAFPCYYCHYSFTQKSSLQRHITSVHKNDMIYDGLTDTRTSTFISECRNACKKKTLKLYSMTLNANQRDRCKRTLQCPKCRRSYAQWKRLYLPGFVNVHPQSNYHPCSKCGKVYTRRSNLSRHMKSECGLLRNHRCHLCRYRANRKDLLQNAANRIVSSDCSNLDLQPSGTSKNIASSQESSNDQSTNSNQSISKRNTCNLCFKNYPSKGRLLRHIETECISRYSHFTCTFCTYRSTYKANMSRHIRNVHKTTNKLRYRCDRCNFAMTGLSMEQYNPPYNNLFGLHSTELSVGTISSSSNQLTVQELELMEKESNNFDIEQNFEEVQEHIEEDNNEEPEYLDEVSLDLDETDDLLPDSSQLIQNFTDIEKTITEINRTCIRVSKEGEIIIMDKTKQPRSEQITIYQCDLCGKIYTWANSLNRHRRECGLQLPSSNNHNNSENQQNETTDEVINDAAIHESASENIDTSINDADENIDRFKSRYRELQKYNMVDGVFSCWDCGRTYQWASSLSRHRTIDCGPKNKRRYVCFMCNYRTGYKANFKRHLKAPRHMLNSRYRNNLRKMSARVVQDENTSEKNNENSDHNEVINNCNLE